MTVVDHFNMDLVRFPTVLSSFRGLFCYILTPESVVRHAMCIREAIPFAGHDIEKNLTCDSVMTLQIHPRNFPKSFVCVLDFLLHEACRHCRLTAVKKVSFSTPKLTFLVTFALCGERAL